MTPNERTRLHAALDHAINVSANCTLFIHAPDKREFDTIDLLLPELGDARTYEAGYTKYNYDVGNIYVGLFHQHNTKETA